MKQVQWRAAMRSVLAFGLAFYVLLVSRLTRWTLVNCGDMQRRAEKGEPFIACFWHGRMMMMPSFWQFQMPLYVLGSRHRDGELIRRTVAHFGVHSIAGSSSHGGPQAIREMLRALRSGASVGISPDGPRGPAMKAAPGMAVVAKLSGARIVPMSYSVSRGRTLRTWDRFFVPYPLGHGIFICGEPVELPADASEAALDAACADLEAQLNILTAEADRLCGRAPLDPPSRQQSGREPSGREQSGRRRAG